MSWCVAATATLRTSWKGRLRRPTANLPAPFSTRQRAVRCESWRGWSRSSTTFFSPPAASTANKRSPPHCYGCFTGTLGALSSARSSLSDSRKKKKTVYYMLKELFFFPIRSCPPLAESQRSSLNVVSRYMLLLYYCLVFTVHPVCSHLFFFYSPFLLYPQKQAMYLFL